MKLTHITLLLIISTMILPSAFSQRRFASQQPNKQHSVRPFFRQVSHIPEIPQEFKEESDKKIWEISQLPNPWTIQDSNDDGKADYALVMYDEGLSKSRESIDNNYDGFLDDFVYFDNNGKIAYQEIDSNYDKQIDIWVEVDNGARVKRIQRDLNYDGVVDRDFQ